MDSKKITMIIVAVILVATAAILGIKLAGKNAQVSSPKVLTPKPAENVAKNNADNSLVQSVNSPDPDVKAIESDLNSVSDDDFSDSALSDQAVGL
jgi:hypothetical protein